ncbi:MAG: hypothetical protein DMD54_17445 [Gemmatimonadetes bacterium]|nr:MAG: hypothetical protein DMD54_17445 [Gemmatimonadota bacterium]
MTIRLINLCKHRTALVFGPFPQNVLPKECIEFNLFLKFSAQCARCFDIIGRPSTKFRATAFFHRRFTGEVTIKKLPCGSRIFRFEPTRFRKRRVKFG